MENLKIKKGFKVYLANSPNLKITFCTSIVKQSQIAKGNISYKRNKNKRKMSYEA